MPCDAVLLSGSCIVNESMLTGESTPEIKQELPNYNPEDPHHLYSPGTDKRYTLYGGTAIIQTRYGGYRRVLALAIRTGF